MKLDYDVIIIGAGPAGIAAATELKAQGIHNIIMIESQNFSGGTTFHSFLPTFGCQTFKCPMTGPQFAKKILRILGHVSILTGTTVSAIQEGGNVKLMPSENNQVSEISAKRVILATGATETAHLSYLSIKSSLSGIFTTESLQQQINIGKQKPCQHPVIIGSELISFSALWTLYKNGIKPKAMLEQHDSLMANGTLGLMAKLMKIPIHYHTQLIDIGGSDHVSYIVTEQQGVQQRIECDAVIFTGQFCGNNQLIKKSHLQHNPNSGVPIVDQLGRCSDGVYYAIGNMLHPADLGDQCYQEGRYIGLAVAYDLKVPPVKNSVRIEITHDDNILFTVPNCLTINGSKQTFDMNIRVKQRIKGVIVIKSGEKVLYKSKRHFLPSRRIMLNNIKAKLAPINTTEISVSIV